MLTSLHFKNEKNREGCIISKVTSSLACSPRPSNLNWPIWELASFIGLIVSRFPVAIYHLLFYKLLEINKTTDLRQNTGNYNAHIYIFFLIYNFILQHIKKNSNTDNAHMRLSQEGVSHIVDLLKG